MRWDNLPCSAEYLTPTTVYTCKSNLAPEVELLSSCIYQKVDSRHSPNHKENMREKIKKEKIRDGHCACDICVDVLLQAMKTWKWLGLKTRPVAAGTKTY